MATNRIKAAEIRPGRTFRALMITGRALKVRSLAKGAAHVLEIRYAPPTPKRVESYIFDDKDAAVAAKRELHKQATQCTTDGEYNAVLKRWNAVARDAVLERGGEVDEPEPLEPEVSSSDPIN